MKLENQVCSLEQAKELYELGIRFENSTFLFLKWSKLNLSDRGAICYRRNGFDNRFDVQLPTFTVAELGLLIADYVDKIWHEYGLWYFKPVEAFTTGSHTLVSISGSEAGARAAYLIDMIKDGAILVDECNKILTTP